MWYGFLYSWRLYTLKLHSGKLSTILLLNYFFFSHVNKVCNMLSLVEFVHQLCFDADMDDGLFSITFSLYVTYVLYIPSKVFHFVWFNNNVQISGSWLRCCFRKVPLIKCSSTHIFLNLFMLVVTAYEEDTSCFCRGGETCRLGW